MMIGITNGRGFGGTINYDIDLDGRYDKDARILAAEGVDIFYDTDGNINADSRCLARSFRIQAMMNPDVKKCVKHLWVSYKPQDQLVMVNNKANGKYHFNSFEEAIGQLSEQCVKDITDEAMVEDIKRLLQDMKYDNTQFLIVRHSEKDNPHVHVIINTVDNDGNRLKDYQEKKRGIEICRQITMDKNYTWGEHKSISEVVSHNPKENVRAEICKEIFEISQVSHTAEEMQMEAARRNIQVKYSTNYRTGLITGISFAKDGFQFSASKVDTSLSANKLFPTQINAAKPLIELSVREQNIVKNGGVVKGFNNQTVHRAEAPKIPQPIKESKLRDEYHKAIKQADNVGSRTAYIQNIVGLALDQMCGSSEKRTEAVLPYIKDEITNQPADAERIQEIIRNSDNYAQERVPIFKRFCDFLYNLLHESFNTIKYPITKEQSERILWSDVIDNKPGRTIGLAREIQVSIRDKYELYRQEKSLKEKREKSIEKEPEKVRQIKIHR